MSTSETELPSWVDTVIIILILLNYLILVPSTLRFMRLSWRLREETYMLARRPKLTLISAFAMLLIIIIHPILLYLRFNQPSNYKYIFSSITDIILLTSVTLPLYPTSARLWLFYYRHKFTEAIFKEKRVQLQIEKKHELEKKGSVPTNGSQISIRQSVSPFARPKSAPPLSLAASVTPTTPREEFYGNIGGILNSQYSMNDLIKMSSVFSNHLQWWIDHKNTWGNKKFISLFFIFGFIFNIIIISVSVLFYDDDDDSELIAFILTVFIFILMLLLITYHVSKLTPYRDEFGLRKQFNLELQILYINSIIWIIYLCIYYLELDSIILRIYFYLNMTITAQALIFVSIVVPLHKFEEGSHRLSSRNVLSANKKQLKIPIFECIQHREGYYLFLEYLMTEFSVENLLFITEVGYMQQKFEKQPIVPRKTAKSTSSKIKQVLHVISDRKNSRSRDNSQSSHFSHHNNTPTHTPTQSDRKVSLKLLKVGSTSPVSSGNGVNTNDKSFSPLSSNSKPSTPLAGRIGKLRDIPSDGAIVTTQSEVENILNLNPDDLNINIDTKLDDDDIVSSIFGDNDDDNKEEDTPPVLNHTINKSFEMGIINGKQLKISTRTSVARNSDILSMTPRGLQLNSRGQIGRGVKLPYPPSTVTLAPSMKQNNLYDCVDMIYDNFIDKDSQYQINISSVSKANLSKTIIQHRLSIEHQRQSLNGKNSSNNSNIKQVLDSVGISIDIHIFDEAAQEILTLLRSAFYRFAYTKQYKIYCRAMGK